ncbi:hypothetical protein DX933_17220 [Ornithinibacillus gellani]|uniref:hypothetical protein n=1 Tax=Ornithinibacillus gellani TaxID=2293253 RepID=UPI000F49EA7D|nr:hypothetical protein [Ornithinibacillus gellani]TQS71090.1 hypothetical protein DX933_17220 [Ornithinibacillus gellani]
MIWTAEPTNRKLLALFHRNLHGYFFERMDTGELIAAIRNVFRGERYIDPAFSALLLAALAE